MSTSSRLQGELRTLVLVFSYFVCWLAFLMLVKQLLLAEYNVHVGGISKALVGALILSKVVMILEYVPLGKWLHGRPAWVDVVVRTALYILGVFVVLVLEKGFEGRHEYDGIGRSLAAVFEHADAYLVWLNLVVVGVALLGYNITSVVERHLGEGGIWRLLRTPLPEEPRHQVKPK